MTPATVRAEIDASLFTTGGSALGRISGPLDFYVLPRTGEAISLLFAPNGLGAALFGAPQVQLKVESVVHVPGAEARVLLMLEDIFVDSPEAGKKLAEYLGAAFDLFYEPYGDGAL